MGPEQPIAGIGTVGKIATGTVSVTVTYMRVSSGDQRLDRQAEEIAHAVGTVDKEFNEDERGRSNGDCAALRCPPHHDPSRAQKVVGPLLIAELFVVVDGLLHEVEGDFFEGVLNFDALVAGGDLFPVDLHLVVGALPTAPCGGTRRDCVRCA
ncbi:hypothetical protein CIP107532_02025 [Corynebacterium diphtheriae]|nr:hypothetical protein CIP107532_02025 [Corynebacterium diphtheriae]